MSRWVLGLIVAMSGCAYDAPSEITCSASQTRAGFSCVGGYWVNTGASDVGITDMTPDQSVADMTADQSVDTPPDVICTPPTTAEFCDDLGKNCGLVSGKDACGNDRMEECGECVSPDTCQTDNTCTCTAEDDPTFCDRLGKDCDDTTAPDNCGVSRTVNCGTCDPGQTCGEDAPNVCGCPCLINGKCVAEGSRNPANQCEACDSLASATEWTLATGASCNDQNKCTENDVCDATGTCAGEAKDCRGENAECKLGQCDASTGNCVAVDVPDQTACTDDGIPCTDDVCIAGACENRIAPATCLIDGACVAADATRGSNVCEKCSPATSTTAWSLNNGALCDDGISCTTGDMCSNRACAGTLVGCYITFACVAEDAPKNASSCLVCDSNSNSTAYTPLAAGSACPVDDGLTCTSQACAADGSCATTIGLNKCLIDGVCYDLLDENPANPCQVCNPIDSKTAWSNKVNNIPCPGAGCKCQSGMCEKGGNTCI